MQSNITSKWHLNFSINFFSIKIYIKSGFSICLYAINILSNDTISCTHCMPRISCRAFWNT